MMPKWTREHPPECDYCESQELVSLGNPKEYSIQHEDDCPANNGEPALRQEGSLGSMIEDMVAERDRNLIAAGAITKRLISLRDMLCKATLEKACNPPD